MPKEELVGIPLRKLLQLKEKDRVLYRALGDWFPEEAEVTETTGLPIVKVRVIKAYAGKEKMPASSETYAMFGELYFLPPGYNKRIPF